MRNLFAALTAMILTVCLSVPVLADAIVDPFQRILYDPDNHLIACLVFLAVLTAAVLLWGRFRKKK